MKNVKSKLFNELTFLLNTRWSFVQLQLESIVALNPERHDLAIITDLDGTNFQKSLIQSD